jgi:hypothetical protein
MAQTRPRAYEIRSVDIALAIKRAIERAGRRGSEGVLRLDSLDRPLLRLKFGPQLPFGFKPISNIVTMLTAARDVDLKRAASYLDVGRLLCRQSGFGHLRLSSEESSTVPQSLTARMSRVSFFVSAGNCKKVSPPCVAATLLVGERTGQWPRSCEHRPYDRRGRRAGFDAGRPVRIVPLAELGAGVSLLLFEKLRVSTSRFVRQRSSGALSIQTDEFGRVRESPQFC